MSSFYDIHEVRKLDVCTSLFEPKCLNDHLKMMTRVWHFIVNVLKRMQIWGLSTHSGGVSPQLLRL